MESAQPVRRPVTAPERKKKQYSIRKTFGIDLGAELDQAGQTLVDAAGRPRPKDRDVTGFEEPTEFTPPIDPSYVFPHEELVALLLGLEVRDNVLLVGHTGTGKTSIVMQVAARLNYNVVTISFDSGVTREHLIGEWVVRGRDMVFQYGLLVLAFQTPGTIILLDEWDTISADCSFVLQRPLDKDAHQILILDKGGELISMHPDNCIMATANTCGQGDETGLYSQGTKVQNHAQLNRFALTVRMSYPPATREVQMLTKRFPLLQGHEAVALVAAANAVRDGYDNGQISVPLSPRDLINWADKFIRMGDSLRAAKYCFLNRCPEEDAGVIEQLIHRAFADAH